MFIREDIPAIDLSPLWIVFNVKLALFTKSYNPATLKLAFFGA